MHIGKFSEFTVDVIQPLTNALSDYSCDSNNSTYSIMNHVFISYDVKFLLKQIHDDLG